jgi:hypothetical protein
VRTLPNEPISCRRQRSLLEPLAVILFDNRIVLYKMESDVMMYVVGSVDENVRIQGPCDPRTSRQELT